MNIYFKFPAEPEKNFIMTIEKFEKFCEFTFKDSNGKYFTMRNILYDMGNKVFVCERAESILFFHYLQKFKRTYDEKVDRLLDEE